MDADNYSTDWYDTAEPTATSYTISDAKDLAGVAKLVNDGTTTFEDKTIQLGGDIDLSAHQWTPIGKNAFQLFKGSFDGNGKTIKGLTITDETLTDAAGLFSWVMYSKISNVTLENVTIDTPNASRVGALAGYDSSTIENVTLQGTNTIQGKEEVGGLVGQLSVGGTIQQATVQGTNTIQGTKNVGGLAGLCYNAENSCVTGNTMVTAKNDEAIGGFVGLCYGAKNCYSTANVQVENSKFVGGFAGKITLYDILDTLLSSCYSTGTVTASGTSQNIGGFVGTVSTAVTFQQCYTISKLDVPDAAVQSGTVGAFSGLPQRGAIPTFENCSYNQENVGEGIPAVAGTTGEVTGLSALTTAQMTGDQWATTMGLTTGWGKLPSTDTILYYPYLTEFGESSSPSVDVSTPDPEPPTPTPEPIPEPTPDNNGGDTGEPTDGQAVQPVDTGVTPATTTASTGNVKTGDPGVLPLGLGALAVGAVGVAISRKRK